MKYYGYYGLNEFIIVFFFQAEDGIRDFLDLYYYSSDLTVRTGDGTVTVHAQHREPNWTVHLIDTDPFTDTGARTKLPPPHNVEPTILFSSDAASLTVDDSPSPPVPPPDPDNTPP